MTTNRLLIATNLVLIFLVFNLMISLSASPAQGVSSGQISACANKSTGALRIASKCAKTENSISWGKQGLTGPRGPSGVTQVPKTQEITLRYLAGPTQGCGPEGQETRGVTTLFLFPWPSRNSIDTNGALSQAQNWDRAYECFITLKVIE